MTALLPAARDRFAGLPPNVRGALWMVGAGLCFSVSDVLVKLVGEALHPVQISFVRACAASLLLLPVLWRSRGRVLATPRPGLQATRTAMEVAAVLLIVYALTQVPLATVTSMVHTRPLFLLVIGALFLREPVGWTRGAVAAIGFVGVALIASPDGQALWQPAILALLGAALFKSGAMAFARRLSAHDAPPTMVAWQILGMVVVAGPPAVVLWQAADARTLAVAAASGLVAGSGLYLLMRAVRAGETTVVAPLGYAQIVIAALWGMLFFAEWPDPLTLAGAVLIVGAGIGLIRTEQHARARQHSDQGCGA